MFCFLFLYIFLFSFSLALENSHCLDCMNSGGPVPSLKPKSMHKDWQPLGYVTQWGGMDVGDGTFD